MAPRISKIFLSPDLQIPFLLTFEMTLVVRDQIWRFSGLEIGKN